MIRPWQVWSIFAVCALLVLTAMAWLSTQAIEADRLRRQAQWEMQREQQISLALWRMDTKLAPLIAEEAARPYYFYNSFYAVDNPYGATKGGDRQTLWLPSPLLSQADNVLLNFENSGTGAWSSPQVPPEKFNTLANDNGLSTQQLEYNRSQLSTISQNVDLQALLDQLPQDAVAQVIATPNQATQAANASAEPFVNDAQGQQLAAAPQIALPQTKISKSGEYDLGQRGSRYQGATQQELAKQRSNNPLGNYGGYGNAPNVVPTNVVDTSVVEGISRPLWVNGQLLLARRIVRDGVEGVQGSWLDWSSIKRELLDEVTDQFPNADLRPLDNPELGDPARMLAGLPVELFIPLDKAQYFASDTIRWTLGLGWIAIITALVAVGVLLWGVVALSERRAAFVSSVTHELRTPLTTFRMYADMLARNMVPDAERRREYLETLQREAERLTHLVENVLSYARLERGRDTNSRQQITVGQLLERQQTRLADRAQQADMCFEITLPDDMRDLTLTTDVGVVEQILFNLVDNAAKYAATADDRRIVCTAARHDRHVELAIRDFGPGFESTRQVTHSRPFSKTAEQAAVTAPGVGLGLALCRRLAKQLGGKLAISQNGLGSVISLQLPLS